MITVESVDIVDLSGMDDIAHYNDRLKAIILTPHSAILGNRDFGIGYDFVSEDPRTALNQMMIQLKEQVKIFMPEIRIKEVTRLNEDAGTDGALRLRITIERNDEYEEEGEDE